MEAAKPVNLLTPLLLSMQKSSDSGPKDKEAINKLLGGAFLGKF